MVPEYDYIIVGGGLAGLYSAYKLNQREPRAKILILERNRAMGGRIDTIHNLEAGAGRFHDQHKLLLTLIGELGLTDKIRPISSFGDYMPSKGPDRGKQFDWKPINTITDKLTKLQTPIPYDITFMEFARTKLTQEEIKLLLDFFGYSSELTDMNAKDTIALMRRHFNSKRQYYSMDGGLSQITERLIGRINATMLTHRRVTFAGTGAAAPRTPPANRDEGQGLITSNGGLRGASPPVWVECEGIKRRYTAHKCIFAVTKDTLLKIPIFKPIYPLLQKIQTLPLCRIYSQVPDMPSVKLTTNNNLRIIIPIDGKTTMISYTDNKYARFWKKMLDEKGMDAVNLEHQRLLRQTLNREIQLPKRTQVYYWEHGVAYFAPGFDSETMPKQIMRPFPNLPIFVCGENFSEKNNQWMEGSLDTSEYILRLMCR
jgi:hypothetical protein